MEKALEPSTRIKSFKQLKEYRRIVVKIGSALLVDQQQGLRKKWLENLCADIAALKAQGVEVLVVSSGAIALGRSFLKMPLGMLHLEESQACAAVGQVQLAQAYAVALARHQLLMGQILLSFSDTEQRKGYLNARATMHTLLELGVVPVINENDTVATSEICYGDNDRLAARVATMMQADLLILLSDIDGLYTEAPQLNPQAQFLPYIETITPEIEAMAGVAASCFSKGGMKTKIMAGKMATIAGTSMIITTGQKMHPLAAIDEGGRYSFFAAFSKPVNAWKRWISGQIEARGKIFIDGGAQEALKQGKSLLPIGVLKVEGRFNRGDTIAIIGAQQQEIARGLVRCTAEEAQQLAGKNSKTFQEILGYAPPSVLVHRDDMLLWDLPVNE